MTGGEGFVVVLHSASAVRLTSRWRTGTGGTAPALGAAAIVTATASRCHARMNRRDTDDVEPPRPRFLSETYAVDLKGGPCTCPALYLRCRGAVRLVRQAASQCNAVNARHPSIGTAWFWLLLRLRPKPCRRPVRSVSDAGAIRCDELLSVPYVVTDGRWKSSSSHVWAFCTEYSVQYCVGVGPSPSPLLQSRIFRLPLLVRDAQYQISLRSNIRCLELISICSPTIQRLIHGNRAYSRNLLGHFEPAVAARRTHRSAVVNDLRFPWAAPQNRHQKRSRYLFKLFLRLELRRHR